MRRTQEYCVKDDILHVPGRKIFFIVMISLFIAFMSGTFDCSAFGQTGGGTTSAMVNIQEGDTWSYLKGIQQPPRKWYGFDFNDSSWQKGASGFGYGSENKGTYLGDMAGTYLSVYARKEFTVNNIYTVTGMSLSIVCDGPFVAYINGIEIIRNDSVSVSTQADQLDVSGFIHELFPGKNLLSVQCSNDDINSKDFSFVPLFQVHEHQGGTAQ